VERAHVETLVMEAVRTRPALPAVA